MTGGAGFSRDAINRTKQNRSLRNSQKNKFKGGVDRSLASGNKKKAKYKQVSKEKLAIIKAKIRAKARREKREKRTILLIIIILALILIITL